jgi:hypothetical protein
MIPPLSMIWNLSTEKLPFQLKNKKEGGLLLSIDKCQSYQIVVCQVGELVFFRRQILKFIE